MIGITETTKIGSKLRNLLLKQVETKVIEKNVCIYFNELYSYKPLTLKEKKAIIKKINKIIDKDCLLYGKGKVELPKKKKRKVKKYAYFFIAGYNNHYGFECSAPVEVIAINRNQAESKAIKSLKKSIEEITITGLILVGKEEVIN